jgi:hypothetical protein
VFANGDPSVDVSTEASGFRRNVAIGTTCESSPSSTLAAREENRRQRALLKAEMDRREAGKAVDQDVLLSLEQRVTLLEEAIGWETWP